MVKPLRHGLVNLDRQGVVNLVGISTDIGKINHVAVFEIPVRTVHAGEGLQQVMRFHNPGKVHFLQPFGIEAGKEHVVNNEKIDFSLLEGRLIFFPDLYSVFIMEDEGGGKGFPINRIWIGCFSCKSQVGLFKAVIQINHRGHRGDTEGAENGASMFGELSQTIIPPIVGSL